MFEFFFFFFISVKLNGGRRVTGILRGFDPFMNLVVDESIEETKTGEKHAIGMVVSVSHLIVLIDCIGIHNSLQYYINFSFIMASAHTHPFLECFFFQCVEKNVGFPPVTIDKIMVSGEKGMNPVAVTH